MQRKSRDILKAIAAGNTCEQILASDGTLTYHDIFHAVTEAPTSYWRKSSGEEEQSGLPGNPLLRTPARYRRD